MQAHLISNIIEHLAIENCKTAKVNYRHFFLQPNEVYKLDNADAFWLLVSFPSNFKVEDSNQNIYQHPHTNQEQRHLFRGYTTITNTHTQAQSINFVQVTF